MVPYDEQNVVKGLVNTEVMVDGVIEWVRCHLSILNGVTMTLPRVKQPPRVRRGDWVGFSIEVAVQ